MGTNTYYGRGKLLLTGEYAIIDGGLGLALPCKFGQHMTIKNTTKSDLHWKALDKDGNTWFESQIALIDFSSFKTTDDKVSSSLQKILKGAVRLNSEFLSKWNGFNVITQLEFPLDWGLGSSSTLIHLVAEWADVHPLLLYFQVYNGSGYDVACAGSDSPITYQLEGDDISYTPVEFSPKFKDNLFFVYLNQKQSSESAVEYYFKNAKKKKELKLELNKITEKILSGSSLSSFIELIDKHEALVSSHLGLDRINSSFGDFNGGLKSLGAWGGDFILAASPDNPEKVKSYFQNKGFNNILGYNEMVFE